MSRRSCVWCDLRAGDVVMSRYDDMQVYLVIESEPQLDDRRIGFMNLSSGSRVTCVYRPAERLEGRDWTVIEAG